MACCFMHFSTITYSCNHSQRYIYDSEGSTEKKNKENVTDIPSRIDPFPELEYNNPVQLYAQ